MLEKQLKDYRLTTAEIIYHLPDYPELLQTYIWQNLDLAPNFPALKRFLAFWEASLEGRLHSVQIANRGIIGPSRVCRADAHLTLH